MSRTWDERAENWDQDERVRFYADQALATLGEHVDIFDSAWKGKRALDFGCGTGLLTEKLAPLVGDVVALDTSPNMIDVLRQKDLANVTPVCADIDDHAVRSSAARFSDFDLIVASSVCSFLPNYERTIRYLFRTLNSGGKIAQWDWLSSGDDNYGMTPERISNAFRGMDLRSIDVRRVFEIEFEEESMPVLMGVATAI